MPDRVIPCPRCKGSKADPIFAERFVPCVACGGSGTIPDRRRATPNDRALQHLLNCPNAVTCKHRHGQPISKRRLDDLSNAQVEYEEAGNG